MQITLTKEQVREAFGELRYMGADYCYKYDKETRKKTEEVEALKLHLGSNRTSKGRALHSGRTRRSGICPLCAEGKLPGIGGQNLLQGYPCCYRKRKRVETVPGNSLRTAPYSVKGAKGVEEVPGTWRKPRHTTKGIAGHELIARFDNIKILKPTGNAQYEGFQILMSGSGCRNYENFLMMNKETWFDFLERVCRYPVNFPRIDLAIDDTKPYLSIPELIRLKNEGLISSQLRDTAENRSDRLKEDEIEAQGKTLYLGSKHSDFRITFYEKGYEQAEKFGKELNPDWNRYELRFRHKKAVRLVEELLKDRDVARIALSVLNEKVRFLQKPENSTVTRKRLYPTYPPWEELMQDVGKIKLTMNPEKKTLERTWQWLNVAVSPSLKLMDKIGKLDNRDYIRQLIERGQMNEEQQRIYEDYKKSFLLREEERRIFDRTYTENDTDKESPYSE